jgi:hypothetical protein
MKLHLNTARLLAAATALLALNSPLRAADDDLEDLRGPGVGNEWQLVKNDRLHDIKLYTKRETGKSLRSFRIEYILEGSLDTLSRAAFDLSSYPRWFYQMKSATLLKKVSEREFYYYAVHKAPAGLPDRDAVLRVTIQPYSAKLGYAMHEVVSVPDYLPPKPPLVRMVAENYTVKLFPLGNNRWRNLSEGYVDPGGYAPDWATNYVQRMAPYQTVLGAQRMVRSPEYARSTEPLPFSYGTYND